MILSDMEELEEEPTAEFLKGFNAGYQMQQEEPELLDKIIKSELIYPILFLEWVISR